MMTPTRWWPGAMPALVAVVMICWSTPLPAYAGGRADLLRICTTGDYRPLTHRDPATGIYSGVDIDMATNLAAFLGREPRFVATTWPTLDRDFTTPGRCDIAMGGITETPARQAIADFTQPYLASGKVPLVAVEDADRFGSIEQIDQPGVRVVENPGGTNEQFARRHFPHADITIWPDNATIFAHLAAGNADVMITDAIEAVYQSSQYPGLVAVHPDRPFTTERKAYMLPKGSPMTEAVEAWLGKALEDGTFGRIYHHWVG
ncbi:MAG: transporter substrate-binding domain-containing protein [Actinomycetia bacterium]|nr:transporter substrate-binding domain-containing protein [Actinomycetes bacterium]MCH9700572.1 transporter substrate-binding domain-containing protein [Actinomycetes bacterium]